MPRILCVSISNLYPQIAEVSRGRESDILLHATALAWRINAVRAAGVTHVFAVANGHVRGVYASPLPVQAWLEFPPGSPDRLPGRRVIPLTRVTPSQWERALGWDVPMYGAVRYGELLIDPDGTWRALAFPQPASEEELSED